MELKTIKLDLIDPHPANPRDELPDIPELAASIKEIGLLQPPAVSSTGGERYIAEFGHRRIAAAKLAGLTEIQVYVKDDDSETAFLALVAENDQHRPLTPAQRDKGHQGLLAFGDVERASRATGVPADKLRAAKKGRDFIDKAKLEQATLDELATISEFSTDPRVRELEKTIGKPNFMNVAAQLRVARKYREESERLILLGIREAVEDEDTQDINYMCDAEKNNIDPKVCETCTAGVIEPRFADSPDFELVCSIDNAVDGHHYKFGGRNSVETPEEIAEREARAKARTEHNDAVEAMQQVRTGYVCALGADVLKSANTLTAIAYYAEKHGLPSTDRMTRIKITESDTAIQRLIALLTEQGEEMLSRVSGFVTNEWNDERNGPGAIDYLTFLTTVCGYSLSNLETDTIKRLSETPAKEGAEVCEECGVILEYCNCDDTDPDDGASVETTDKAPETDTDAEGAHEGEIGTSSTEASLAFVPNDAFSSTAASQLWKRALDEGTAKLNLKGVGALPHWDIHLTLTIADISTEAATVRFIVAGAPGKFPTDAIAIATKLGIVGGVTFDAPTQGIGGLWAFEALLEADCTEDCDKCPADLESNPMADARISKEFAQIDADRILIAIANGDLSAQMHWNAKAVYTITSVERMNDDNDTEIINVTAHPLRPIRAALTDARLFADRYAEAMDFETAGLSVEGSTITLKFAAKGGE